MRKVEVNLSPRRDEDMKKKTIAAFFAAVF